MNWIVLVGLPVIVVGFLLRLRVPFVVLAAGLATGFAAKMAFVGTTDAPGILDTLGKAFVDFRTVSLFVLALPAVGLLERYGIQEEARRVILRLRAATAGRVQVVYHAIRLGIVALGLRLSSGQVTFSRPVVLPMGLAAAGLPEDLADKSPKAELVKAASAASDNYANFFGQNLFPASAGVALMVKTFETNGISLVASRVALWTIPVAALSTAIAIGQYALLDRRLGPRTESPEVAAAPEEVEAS